MMEQMVLDRKVYQAYLDVLRQELVPATGCTEPIAIAYAGAIARKTLGQVPEQVKNARSAQLIALGRRKQQAYEDRLIGKCVEVLMEEAVEREDGIYQVGHTKEYVKVGQKTTENLANQLINVEIENRLQIIH